MQQIDKADSMADALLPHAHLVFIARLFQERLVFGHLGDPHLLLIVLLQRLDLLLSQAHDLSFEGGVAG